MTLLIPSDEMLSLFGDSGSNWIQGEWSSGDGMCLHEGIKRCVAKQPGDFHLIAQVAKSEGWGVDWNDEDGRNWSEVKAKIFEIAEITTDRLEAVFGPQWREVVAIIRRAAVLTDGEVQSLTAVRAELLAVSPDPWWDVPHNSEWAAPMIAAWAASKTVMAGTARPVCQATCGVSVRHLLGRYGLNEACYDRLTRPWREVIGPVHPDDTP